MSHSLLPFVEVNPTQEADACVIWMHGLGDSGHGFAPIVSQLSLPDNHRIRFIFPHAPERAVTINGGMRMRAWYDIKSLDFNSRADVTGVIESSAQVRRLIEKQIADGVSANRILLAGFSQGGVIALHEGTRFHQSLAGIMALSTYMCEPQNLATEAHEANKKTPVFVAHGEQDEVVPVFLGNTAFKVLKENGYNCTWHTYTMQHNVCMAEIKDISEFITRVLPLQ
ncbi:alpha/beta hydrolase [Alteromonas sp. ASW11-130]|uniref:alpha/beta hydrolase n=1 Tax=Alteromonas sp. ASW11-130 TaxID=3015775 RepID=UPI002241CCEE|nr:carboxylesterase [Alteromonas sp. ASW11-130]MCW8091110.1 alpha/beta hydrolase [Alteromonas sp. ASW11-130]